MLQLAGLRLLRIAAHNYAHGLHKLCRGHQRRQPNRKRLETLWQGLPACVLDKGSVRQK